MVETRAITEGVRFKYPNHTHIHVHITEVWNKQCRKCQKHLHSMLSKPSMFHSKPWTSVLRNMSVIWFSRPTQVWRTDRLLRSDYEIKKKLEKGLLYKHLNIINHPNHPVIHMYFCLLCNSGTRVGWGDECGKRYNDGQPICQWCQSIYFTKGQKETSFVLLQEFYFGQGVNKLNPTFQVGNLALVALSQD